MAFSIFGILSVILEAIRPLVPFLLAWIAIDVVLLMITFARGQFPGFQARKTALRAGLLFMVGAFVAGPWLTQASFGDLTGAVDWLLLAAMAFAVGIAGFLLTLPVANLLR